ncbi:MAG: hypothetical protein HY321_05535 [Armatimonadetes bacterium]|nr:hypothetical protein [Armatimonadota bacterium]
MHGMTFAALIGLTALGAAVRAGASPAPSQVTGAIPIGSRLELFVDDYLIDKMSDLSLRLHCPTPREIAIRFDSPSDGATSAYVTVFKDGDLYRMYYRGSGMVEGGHQVTCYAESRDGIAWAKPSLGLYELQGSRENNIVWMGPECHNFAAFRDDNPAAPPSHRYKAIGGNPPMALVSPDGIHWRKLLDRPIISRSTHDPHDYGFDSQNNGFWDAARGRYVAYLRSRFEGSRSIRRSLSDDFLHWMRMEQLEFTHAPREATANLYTNGIIPYFRAPHLYLGFPKRFTGRQAVPEHPHSGVSDGVFMSSRDGLRWRFFAEAFIRPGLERNNWTERSNMPVWGVVPTSPEEISLYWSEHYRHPTSRLRRGTLRTDGFVSVHADFAGGEFVTKPLTFAGKELVINYATSAVGSVQVEIRDANGEPIPGFGLTTPIFGDHIERVVAWPGGADVSQLAERPIRLRFVLKDADVYALRFRE